ncbi:hypothetical protein DID77_03995, partial [Candidatus Marinamargulisbacteria bacterium SCGC AG-439-L15]
MHKRLFWGLVGCFFYVTLGFGATSFPKQQGYVTDHLGVISTQERALMSAISRRVELASKVQIATVVIETLPPNQTVESYASRLFEDWGIGGKSVNKGLLLLLFVKDKKIRVEVGYGLEGVVSDGKSGELLDEYVIPYFKKGNLSKGLLMGHLSLAQHIATVYDFPLDGAAPVRQAQPARPLGIAELI